MPITARFWSAHHRPQATELIAEAVAAMELEATVEDLMWTIHAHPTLAEAMLDAANSVYGIASRLKSPTEAQRHGEDQEMIWFVLRDSVTPW